jgi:hypothetical protein
MLIDLQTLEATVRFRGDYQNVRKFPSPDVCNEIQGSFAEFYELVANTHEGYWDTQANVTTTNNVAFVALPADCWRVQGVDRLDGTDYIELAQVAISERNRFGTMTDQPSSYRLTARGLDLLPTPDATYTLRVMYTPIAPLLQTAAMREWFNGWEDYVICAALLRLDQREQRPLSDRLATLERAKARIISGVTERRSAEPEYLRLREFGSVDRWDRGLE